MQGLSKNKRSFWYALYERSQPLTDEYGREVGEMSVYSKPIKAVGNISAARGSAEHDTFGINAVYTKTINPMPLDCPITETSILWIDIEPELNEYGNTTTAHDYVVSQVAESLNHKAYAISRVEVTYGGAVR